jgi:hypothetical protein
MSVGIDQIGIPSDHESVDHHGRLVIEVDKGVDTTSRARLRRGIRSRCFLRCQEIQLLARCRSRAQAFAGLDVFVNPPRYSSQPHSVATGTRPGRVKQR